MKEYSFPFSFRFDVNEPYESCFTLTLSNEEVGNIKSFVKNNPGLPFWAMDYDYPDLFEKMINAHTAAIVATINDSKKLRGESPITEEDIDWEDISLLFDWPVDFVDC